MGSHVASPLLESLQDRYRLARELGRGGMATVYLAEDRKHHRQVAIKVMNPEIAAAIGRDRFLREIEIAARLNHPHVVPLFDSGATSDLLFYVMPYVAGESLRQRLILEGQLDLADALRIAREVASALGHAHQHGLVHRDIKPENILLADGIALVSDFGIARTVNGMGLGDGTQFATIAGAVVGTPQYMSPEQAIGRDVDARSDIYSLGCVLFEMLAGQPPFVGGTPDAVLRMHIALAPPPVTTLRPAIPAAVAQVIARALAKTPADRYGTAAQFAEALSAATSGALTPATSRAAARLPPNNLPRPRTHFIGREQELADCVRLLGDTRLLTLTGIGGAGKTRLGLKVAEHLLPDFLDGVWFVDLGPLSEGSRVVEAVAAALGVRETAGRSLSDLVREHVAGRRLLLLLDNCEHLLADVAGLVDDLLEEANEVRIVATSREGLGVEGERLFALRSLALPPAATCDLAGVQASEAVQLFLDRAQRAARDFALTDLNAGAIVEICRRLDGIPLAIELAASRVKVLSVEQIRSRLDDRFRLLTGGSRTSLPRQQTLQATLQWSYDQLTSGEQRLFRMLSVFAGGWTLEAATFLAGDPSDEFLTLDLLSRLIDKSLVIVTRDAAGSTRYSLLETVRQYAAEQLAAAGGVRETRDRHAGLFAALAERAYSGRITDEGKWSAVLQIEHDNLRGALDFLREADSERHLGLAGALAWFWQARSCLSEGRDHLKAALAGSSESPPRGARARALWGAASLLAWQGDAVGSLQSMETAVQMWRQVGDMREVAVALDGLGWAQFLGGDDEQACATFEESLRLQRRSGDPHLINRAMVSLAQVLVALERIEDARAFSAEILAFSRAHHDARSEHSGWHYLADCALIEGRCAESLGHYGRSLTLALETGDHIEIGFEVQGIAMSLAGLDRARLALRLAGAIEAEMQRIGAAMRVRFWDALLDRYLGRARRDLGEVEAAGVLNEGRSMEFEQAIAQARQAASS